MSDKKLNQKDDNNINQNLFYSKDNLYYRREKRKNILLLVIIFILLIYMWFCFIYHWGYIKNSTDSNKRDNTVDTSGDVNITDDDKKDYEHSNSTNQEGPYYLTDKDKNDFTSENNENIIINNSNQNTSNNLNNNNIINNDPINNLTSEEVEKIKLIQTSDEKEFKELNNLDIFKNFEYNESKLIYPGLSGTYNFNVENYSAKNIKYKLTFTCNNPQNVNMKYKLKRNGQYIAGDNNTYVSIEEITKENLELNTMMGDVYFIDWKWIDNDIQDINSSNSITRGEYNLTIRGEV